MHPKDYIQYLEAFETIHRETLIFIQTERTYPVATLAGVELHFMHYASEQEAIEKYWKRFQRIDHQRILTKIDFGKPSYKLADIERWNELKIPNSVAFYPSNREIPPEGVHQGVPVPDWVIGGVEMFDITRKHFDLHKWLRTGMVESTTFHRLLNRLVFEPPR